MSRDGWAALPRGSTGLSAVCNCGISWSYSLTIFNVTAQRGPTGLSHFQHPHWTSCYVPTEALNMEFWLLPAIIHAWPVYYKVWGNCLFEFWILIFAAQDFANFSNLVFTLLQLKREEFFFCWKISWAWVSVCLSLLKLSCISCFIFG